MQGTFYNLTFFLLFRILFFFLLKTKLANLKFFVGLNLAKKQVTKSKTWKDIAGLLGIGASSSAAYTLRKHYTKNLLAFECHFDRGGVDPLPIIQQVEAGSKKKTTKAASVPSPGKLIVFHCLFLFL